MSCLSYKYTKTTYPNVPNYTSCGKYGDRWSVYNRIVLNRTKSIPAIGGQHKIRMSGAVTVGGTKLAMVLCTVEIHSTFDITSHVSLEFVGKKDN